MIENNLTEEKKEIRKRILEKRNLLNKEERLRARILLTERILGHQWFYCSEILLAFASYGSEIETEEVIREALRQGKSVFLPKVITDTFLKEPYMEFFRINNIEELELGYRKIPEPSLKNEKYVYDEKDAAKTLMLMPGVAFDRYRNRIGYGKGFYDRFLEDKEKLQLRTIGIGFQCQLEEKIPVDERDIRPSQVICV